MKRFISTEDLFLVKNLFFFKYDKHLEFVTKEGKVYPIYGFVLEKDGSITKNRNCTLIRIYTLPLESRSRRNRTSIRFYKYDKYEQVPFDYDTPDDYNVTKECLDAIYEFIENKIIQYDDEKG